MHRRASIWITTLVSFLVLSAAAMAQPSRTPAVVLKAAHLFDGVTGQIVDGGVIAIQGSTILAVGARIDSVDNPDWGGYPVDATAARDGVGA